MTLKSTVIGPMNQRFMIKFCKAIMVYDCESIPVNGGGDPFAS